ncbi:uncharacterized protein [Branchiostoma lanceolatum]|uniref:uncharacterized protein n=1 Tax=Branchiostoma lanceolatum TaxID=7740 RepID=UPI00345617A4
MKALCSSTSPLSKPVKTITDIRNFSVEDTTVYLETHAPTLHRLIGTLTSPTYIRASGERSESVAMLIISTIANHRSHRTSGVQTIMTLGYLARTCNDQLLTLLNHAGVGVSSRNVWRIIRDNAAIEMAEPLPTDGEIWAYDNVNIMVKVQQVRKGHRSEMKNWTSRITVPVRHVPDEGLSREPRGRRGDLKAEDILLDEEEMDKLEKRFGARIKALLSNKFKAFAAHKRPPPKKRTSPPSSYRPVQLMGANEATTADNIHILRQFAKEAGMSADNCWDQEVIGDQATCKNIRGARRLREDDVDRLERLVWAKECPGDFHFLWETARCIALAYWSSPKNVGSLAHLNDVVNRRSVDSLGKKFNPLDEFLHHACEAHLEAALLQHLEMGSPSEDVEEMTEEELESLVQSFLAKYIFKRCSADRVDDAAFECTTSLLYHLMLYTDLRQCIRDEDGPAVVAHWRWWLPTFLGTKRTQYSTEAANHLANLMADWSPRTAHVLTHNRGVNTHSREGHGKPVDMLVEHYNKLLKKVLKSSGGHLTLRHAKEVSLAVPLIDEARRFCDRVFKARQTVGHTSPSAEADIRSMRQKISDGLVYQPTPGRVLFFGKEFDDPVSKGLKRITVDKWLDNYLHKEDTDDEEDAADAAEVDPDLEVDLAVLMDE